MEGYFSPFPSQFQFIHVASESKFLAKLKSL